MTASLASALQVSVALFAVFVVYPYLFFRLPPIRGAGPAIRFWQLVLGSLAMWLGFSFLLAMVGSLTLTALAGVGVAGALGMRRFGPKPPQAKPDEEGVQQGHRQASRLLDAMDQGKERSVALLALQDAAGFARRLLASLAELRRPATALTALVIAAAAGLRLQRALAHASPVAARGFSDLLAIKQIAINQGLFASGVFPEGLHVTVALLSTLFFYDSLNVLRFASPAIAFGLTLAAATLATELSRSRWAGLVAAALTGLTAVPGLAAAPWHLTVPLTLKAALAFYLLALLFGLRAHRHGEAGDLLSLAMAVFLLGLFDPWLLPFAAIPVLCLAIAKRRSGQRGLAASLLKALLYPAAASLLPLAIGYVTGHSLNAYLWTNAPTTAEGASAFLGSFWGAALAGLLIIYLLVVVLFSSASDGDRPFWGGLILMAAATLALVRVAPAASIATEVSVGGLLGITLAVAVPSRIFSALFASRAFRRAEAMLAIFLAAFAAVAAPLTPLPAAHVETPGAGHAYLKISSRFPRYEWTIISPTEQYSEVLGRGWHVELETFLRTENLAEAANPNFQLRTSKVRIQTPDTFLFVDLEPQGLNRQVTAADSQLPLPPAGTAHPYAGLSGAALEGRALVWGEDFMKAHPKDASIFYHSPNLIVFWIRQPGP